MRPIDADALLENIKAYFGDCIDKQDSEIIDNTILVHNKNISKIIRQALTVEERPRGEWEVLDECSNAGVYCSKCHKKVYNIGYSYNRIKMPYCPNCGSYNGHSVRGEGE